MKRKVTKSLIERVYECHTCRMDYGFSSQDVDGPYFKFPPTIGAPGKAEVLFVGINPRLRGNRVLHRRLRRLAIFEEFALNRDGRRAFIAVGGPEPHYASHMAVVEGLFGPGAKFEDHAAATELFFCASANSKLLPESGSDCADEYLEDVLAQVEPRAIVCVGERVLKYVQEQFDGGEARVFKRAGNGAFVVCIPHPADQRPTGAEREFSIEAAVVEIRSELGL